MNFKSYFYNVYLEQYQGKLESNKWEDALRNSDELNVAVQMMKEIKQKFPDRELYIVGGVPRDLLMGDNIDDVDLATNIPFSELDKYYELRNISKNDSQPVYKINYGGYSFDLAKFRTDSKTAGRQNNISTETDSFKADTDRRDITINSFGLTENGEIVDYQGGVNDLNAKLIKAVGNAKERFIEDATRILRIARFAAKLGFAIEPSTKQAVIEMKHLINDRNAISMESISKEFYKAAKSGKTLRRFLEHLIDAGILNDILPEFHMMDNMMHDIKHHPEGEGKVIGHIMECLSASPYKDPVINLAVLFHDFGKASTYKFQNDRHTYHGHEAAGVPIVENIFKRLSFPDLSAKDKVHILNAVAKHMMIHNLDKLNIKTLTGLINDSGWEVLKAVGYCDEASRGPGLFNKSVFNKKIQDAEQKVKALGDADTLKKKIAQYIDGKILMDRFPILQTKQRLIGQILPKLQEKVLNDLNSGIPINQEELFAIAEQILKTIS